MLRIITRQNVTFCPHDEIPISGFLMCLGGERGIRTLGTVARTLLFESSTFNHSVTSPLQPIVTDCRVYFRASHRVNFVLQSPLF